MIQTRYLIHFMKQKMGFDLPGILTLISLGGCASGDPVYVVPAGPDFPPPPAPFFAPPGEPGFGPPPGLGVPPPGP